MHSPAPSGTSSNTSRMRRHVVEKQAWLDAALNRVNQAAATALAARGEFHLVLAGGGTPEKLYRALSGQEQDWSRWHLWFGDERCLPTGAPQRNSQMAASAWLDRVAIPAGNIHVIPAELGPDTAARAYAQALDKHGVFDLVLLGLGQDGHTASLFPGHDWGIESDAPAALPVRDAPKPPPERVTLSARRLSQTRGVLFLITGADKRDALNAWQRGVAIPAAAIQPDAGIDLLIDTDACPPGEPE
ncbi:MAG: 6-phosphogluconolactonase [Hydrogenophilales bacterium 28-61-23]|nr:MAG: 6-phosphogluconolactonase [Hydrogenophilales bacterium 28-61-23]